MHNRRGAHTSSTPARARAVTQGQCQRVQAVTTLQRTIWVCMGCCTTLQSMTESECHHHDSLTCTGLKTGSPAGHWCQDGTTPSSGAEGPTWLATEHTSTPLESGTSGKYPTDKIKSNVKCSHSASQPDRFAEAVHTSVLVTSPDVSAVLRICATCTLQCAHGMHTVTLSTLPSSTWLQPVLVQCSRRDTAQDTSTPQPRLIVCTHRQHITAQRAACKLTNPTTTSHNPR